MTPTNPSSSFRIYLLSVWQELDSGKGKLRFRLEDPHTGERLGFDRAEALVDHIQDELLDPQIKRDL
jgi:hypothetical protein